MGKALAMFLVLVCSATAILFGSAALGGTSQSCAQTGGGGPAQQVTGVRLSAEQLANASTITTTTRSRRLPPRAAVIAIATAMTESTLHNYHQFTDHDSLGLFQQRVSIYTAAVATDPVRATTAFLARLVRVRNWQTLPLTVAAQDVQVSAFPDRYAKYETLADSLVSKYWKDPGTVAAASSTGCVDGTGVADSQHGGSAKNAPPGLQLPTDETLKTVVTFALAQLGKPYVWDAAGPDAYDCSGLMLAAWARAGVALPHSTYLQVNVGIPVANTQTMLPGDLILIQGAHEKNAPPGPGHVGMYIGTAHGVQWLINAPTEGEPVQTDRVSAWANQIVAIRRPSLTADPRL